MSTYRVMLVLGADVYLRRHGGPGPDYEMRLIDYREYVTATRANPQVGDLVDTRGFKILGLSLGDTDAG